jgi:hypothetical protein
MWFNLIGYYHVKEDVYSISFTDVRLSTPP